MFYPLGALQTWKMTTELFEYSNEKFSTGIAEIDILQSKFDTNDLDWGVLDESGNYIKTEDGDFVIMEQGGIANQVVAEDNDDVKLSVDEFLDFSTEDPFGDRAI